MSTTNKALEMVNPKLLNTISFLGRLGVKKVKGTLDPEAKESKIYITVPKTNDIENIDLSLYPYQDKIDIEDYDLNDPEEVAELSAAIIKEMMSEMLMDFSNIPEELRNFNILRSSTLSTIRVFSKVRNEDWNVRKSIENADHVVKEAMVLDASINLVKLKLREQL